MFNLAKEFLSSMDQFRCIYVETYSEIKTVSILDAAAIADLYIEAIAAVVKERKDAIERGNK
jgi:predicted HTH domain antitoxin